MREQKRIAVAEIDRDADQPRKHFDESELLALAANLKAVGQQLPVIVYANGTRYTLLDGERRYRASQLGGLKELSAVVLDAKPSAAELLIIQASIDVHRASLRPMERSNLLARILKETGCSVTEVGEKLGVKQAMASKLLSFQKLAPVIQQKLDAGELDMERAYMVSQEPDHARQLELLKGNPTRDQLRQKAKGNGAAEAKASVARFALQAGLQVTVHGREVTLGGCIEALQETVKELKRGQSQGLDITTQQKVMKDKAKAVR